MNFEDFKKNILNCKECADNFGYNPRPIFQGNADSLIMQISQAPSNNVYQTNKPWNDSSGKKLIYDWYQINEEVFYNPKCFYISDLARCYPGKNKKGKGDNKPPKICQDLWMEEELKLINCKLYIIIGSHAAKYFFPKENFNDLVFKNNIYNNRLAIVLPHPSPLNIKWFKENPDFYSKRLLEIRKIIKDTLDKVVTF